MELRSPLSVTVASGFFGLWVKCHVAMMPSRTATVAVRLTIFLVVGVICHSSAECNITESAASKHPLGKRRAGPACDRRNDSPSSEPRRADDLEFPAEFYQVPLDPLDVVLHFEH